MRKYNGESQPTLENQGYFFEKVTFALSGNSRRVRGILGSKNKLHKTPQAGGKKSD